MDTKAVAPKPGPPKTRSSPFDTCRSSNAADSSDRLISKLRKKPHEDPDRGATSKTGWMGAQRSAEAPFFSGCAVIDKSSAQGKSNLFPPTRRRRQVLPSPSSTAAETDCASLRRYTTRMSFRVLLLHISGPGTVPKYHVPLRWNPKVSKYSENEPCGTPHVTHSQTRLTQKVK